MAAKAVDTVAIVAEAVDALYSASGGRQSPVSFTEYPRPVRRTRSPSYSPSAQGVPKAPSSMNAICHIRD